MITAKRLRELLQKLPDDAALVAYEGEGIGLRVIKGDLSGWIETGWSDEVCKDDSSKHDLTEFSDRSQSANFEQRQSGV